QGFDDPEARGRAFRVGDDLFGNGYRGHARNIQPPFTPEHTHDEQHRGKGHDLRPRELHSTHRTDNGAASSQKNGAQQQLWMVGWMCTNLRSADLLPSRL